MQLIVQHVKGQLQEVRIIELYYTSSMSLAYNLHVHLYAAITNYFLGICIIIM